MISERNILFVDDNENILQSMQRQLKRDFHVLTATSGQAALDLLQTGVEVAVVISDMRMPEMDGIDFLKRIHTQSPVTVRIMLTGNADSSTPIQAVNQANVFRFLNKPVNMSELHKALLDSLELYELKIAEKVLLNDTVKGVTELLSELISFVDPELYGTASTLKMNIREVAKQLNIMNPWELEVAALLSQVGVLALPHELRSKMSVGETLTAEEQEVVDQHPESAHAFLKNIPRLQPVADMVRYQNKNFDGSGIPHDDVSGEAIPLGARVLRVLNEVQKIMGSTGSLENALVDLAKIPEGIFDPEAREAVIAALRPRADLIKNDSVDEILNSAFEDSSSSEILSEEPEPTAKFTTPESLLVNDLAVGHIPIKEIRSLSGVLIMQPGQILSEANIQRIVNYHRFSGIIEPIIVVKVCSSDESSA